MEKVGLWQRTQEWLKDRLGQQVFETWLQPLKGEKKENVLVLSAPDDFFRDWIKNHYLDLIKKALQEIEGHPIAVELKTQTSLEAQDSLFKKPSFLSKHKTEYSLFLNPRYTFENFVVGPSNRFAHACALAVTESPARTYNPLFIYGGVGLGKTHLIQAICHRVLQLYGQQIKVVYLSSEQFTNELIEAIRHRTMENFRYKYRSVDILVVDDIQFIAGKESTQEEFFHTFNTLYDAHKQIVISSDRSPKEIPDLEERLVSRFSWGLITDIQPPDLETRVAILKKKIEKEPVKIDEEVIFFIAQLIKTNIRDLEGALIRIVAYALLENRMINLDLAKEVLKDLIKQSNKLITPEQILQCVGAEFHLSLQELKSKKRNKNIVFARQLVMYLCRELTELSLPEIGNSLGGKNHTTVLHAYNKIKSELQHNIELQETLERIIKTIKSY
ncbi:MAG: chromosomal replication initiator protein DnaA [Candidatus Omnitrophica bacterium]|nr:chromosomal replication initiator protein DnaA [Candidatus Omnitrophota bacterium]